MSSKITANIKTNCKNCAKSVENKLGKIKGILEVNIDPIYNRLTLSFNPQHISRREIITHLKRTGYSITITAASNDDSVSLKVKQKTSLLDILWKKKEVYPLVISGMLLFVGILLFYLFKFELSSQIVFICATIIGGLFIFKKAYYSIRLKQLDINVLMTIAAIAAIIIGESLEAALIVVLFSFAELLETLSIDKAKQSLEKLMDYAPNDVTLIDGTTEKTMLAEKVPVGSTIKVKPGERIPLDGIIVSGESFINQAPITGEPIPIEKNIGEKVYAGTLNETSVLILETIKPFDQIFLKKIIELVEKADRKAPIERFIDTFAKYYTPLMFLIAILTMIIPPLITGQPFLIWIYRALIILVISCPCAVVLATPITLVTALNHSAKNGILIKGGSYIEQLSKTRIFAFDKTGTLTIGKPTVVDIITEENFSQEKILRIAGSLEVNSNHPIAQAINQKLQNSNIAPFGVKNFKSFAGKGIGGEINGDYWWVGNLKLLRDLELILSDQLGSELAILQSEQKTVTLVGNKKRVVGLIAVSDELRPHAKGVIHELKALGIEKIWMITGDNSKIAASIAKNLEIDEYRAEMLPDQKMQLIEELDEQLQHVVMVGDGINDAPALALADVGIAMGAAGSDTAIESADVALMSDRLDTLPFLISLSKRVMKIVKQNIFFALLVKLILFILAYTGLISLWIAVLVGDMGVSLAVIFNALLRAKGQIMSHEYCDEEVCTFDEIAAKEKNEKVYACEYCI
ncbi:MAG: heavy metal translocating P-type ATPase [Candidatus Heimdallarchaeota archaeon]|nr:heavy metal translocating P-type ATPase [Candidatus Heimdallarchaeota archaeon]